MIPNQTLTALKWCVKVGSKLNCIPYDWSEHCGCLVRATSKVRAALWHLTATAHLGYALYIALSFISGLFISESSEKQRQNLMLHALFLSIFVTTNVFSVHFQFHSCESVAFVNSLLLLNRRNQGKMWLRLQNVIT